MPTDFSAPSLKALDFAVPLAAKFGAEVILLHVVEPVTYADNLLSPGEIEQVRAGTRRQRKKILDAIIRDKVDREITSVTLVTIGKPHEEIIQAAKSMRADMIIIATHGYTGLKHVWLGSTTEKVVRRAQCPVLTVRAAAQNEAQPEIPAASKSQAGAANPVRDSLIQVGLHGSWPVA